MSDPTTSLFTENKEGSTQNPPQGVTSENPLADLLGSIKNERGEVKYKDVESALIGLKNAQEFIPTLQKSVADRDTELAALRAKADRAAELERVIESLTSGKAPEAVPPAAAPAHKEVDVSALVEAALTNREKQQVAKTNVSSVLSAVKNAFGDKSEEVFYGKAKELGMSVAEFNALTATSPKAVLTMLGIAEGKSSFGTTPTSVNSSGFVPTKETFITKNKNPVLVGATSEDVSRELASAKQMVVELHSQGKSINDLTNPKVFFKHFA